MPKSPAEITLLLQAWRRGDPQALDRLTPLVYDHLRGVARRFARRERGDGRLDATSLVHEAYMRLLDARQVNWQDRGHFFAISSSIMRRILVDAARARGAAKRGGGMQRVVHPAGVEFDRLPGLQADHGPDVCALDDALDALARHDPRRAKVVELRFFGGLTVEETAETLGVSVQTVMRDWRLARAWLAIELGASGLA